MRDKHKRPLYDTIHVASVNPVFLYSMKPTNDQMVRIPLNHFFDNSSRGGSSSWRNNILPKLKMAPLGGRYQKCKICLLNYKKKSHFSQVDYNLSWLFMMKFQTLLFLLNPLMAMLFQSTPKTQAGSNLSRIWP